VTDERDPFIERLASELRRPGPPDDAARARIMQAVRAEGPVAAAPFAGARRAMRWLRAPRTVRISPLAGIAAAAAVTALAFLGRAVPPAGKNGAPALRAASEPAGERLASRASAAVQFVLVAPGASHVALVGDFNAWDARATALRQDRATGVWTAEVRLPPGRHVYAFVVDDRTWMADPTAPRAPGDDFGSPNSVIMVGD
jgi:hypothetical protein